MTIARRPIASIEQVEGLQGALDGKAAVAHESALTGVHGIVVKNTSYGLGGGIFSALTTGTANSAFGLWAARSLTSGANDSAFGYDALYSLTTGNSNSAFGSLAGFSITSGSSNVFFGQAAGRYLSDGTTPNQTQHASVHIGVNTRASVASATNETVIGYAAIGGGSNTVRLGNSSVTNWLPGATNVCALGNSTTAFKELYLHDGTDEWKVTINTSGVLTTTKV